VLYRLAARDYSRVSPRRKLPQRSSSGTFETDFADRELRCVIRACRVDLSSAFCGQRCRHRFAFSRGEESSLVRPLFAPPRATNSPSGGTGVGDVVGLPVRDAGTSVICRMRETLAVPARRRTRSAVGKRSGARRETRVSEKRRERTAERESREGAVDFRDSACSRRVASAGPFRRKRRKPSLRETSN